MAAKIDIFCKLLRDGLRNLTTETYFTFQLLRHPFAVDNGKKALLLAELNLSDYEKLRIGLHYTSRGVRFSYIQLMNHEHKGMHFGNKECMPRFEKICLKQVKRDLAMHSNLPQKLGDF
jgi:hypothetical protein|nr:MAG TPA: hypothetical protein [Caudoviricetes sp.]